MYNICELLTFINNPANNTHKHPPEIHYNMKVIGWLFFVLMFCEKLNIECSKINLP